MSDSIVTPAVTEGAAVPIDEALEAFLGLPCLLPEMVAGVLRRRIRVWRCHTQSLEEGLFIRPYPTISVDPRYGTALHGAVHPGSFQERFKLCLAVLGQERQFIPEPTIDQVHQPADGALAACWMIHSLMEDFVRVGVPWRGRAGVKGILAQQTDRDLRALPSFGQAHIAVPRPHDVGLASAVSSFLGPDIPIPLLFRGERHDQLLAVTGMISSYLLVAAMMRIRARHDGATLGDWNARR